MDWGLVMMFGMLMFMLTLFNVKVLRVIHLEKELAGYEFLPYDLKITKQSVTEYLFAGLAGGFCGGCLGIGGGMIFGPIFLHFH